MAYTPQQRQVIATANRLSAGAPQKARRALLEALLVETGARPLTYGDRDSVGVLQQRPSQGWGPASETPAQDIRQFLQRAVPLAGRFQTAGQLAQAVQRSAFPDRYDQRKAEAVRLLASGTPASASSGTGVLPPAGVPGGGQAGGRRAATGDALLRGLAGIVGLPASSVPSVPQAPSSPPRRLKVRYQTGARPTPRVRNVVNLAHEYLGVRYQWGGEDPQTGFDCSGLVQYLYGQQGVTLPRRSQDQWRTGMSISRNQLQPGDAVFFHAGPEGPEHEGLYVGGGKFIHAPHTGDVVKVSSLNSAYYKRAFLGGRRFA